MSDDGPEPTDDATEETAGDGDFAKAWVNTDDTDGGDPIDVTNVKQEWENLTIYVPEQLREEIELAFRETSYECLAAADHDLQKLRDFYPLLLVLGLGNLESIEGEEVTDILRYIAAEYGE